MTLCRESVSPGLLDLLRKLMREKALEAFALGGGTSLALRFGHRESVDIDLFTTSAFESRALADRLKIHHGMVEAENSENSVSGVIAGIKVNLIARRYPLLAGIEGIEGIRMLSLEDISAMKLNAIANRGSKKDFWDFAELLTHFSRDEMLDHYAKKYPGDSLWNISRSLSYFDDAERQPDPMDLRGRKWMEVKRTIQRHNRL